MAQESNSKIVGLVGLLVVGLGLLWWLGRGEAEPSADASDKQAAAVDPSGGLKPSGPTPKVLRGSDIDPLVSPRAEVTGTVRDDRGQPIAKAQVCAKLNDYSLPNVSRTPPRCVETRDDGTYRIDDLFGTDYNLFASASGFLPVRYEARRGIQQTLDSDVTLRAGATRSGIDFVLKEGGVEVKGVVKDIAGGVVEGAWISSSATWWGGGRAGSFTRSDENGNFSMWVEPPQVNLSAFAEGYTKSTRSAAVPGSFVEVFLTPESVVIGRVVWADTGKPVADAHVSVRGTWWSDGGGTDRSGEDGSFRIEGIEPGSYKVRVSDEELRGSSDQKVHVGLGETSEPVVVKVHRAYSVRGTVLVGGETPCSDGSISLKNKDRKNESSRDSDRNEDGSVLVKGVMPGTYEVTVSCEGYVAESEYPDLVIADASLDGLTWSVREGQQILGTVVDAAGNPIEGVRVGAQAKADGDNPRAQRSNSWGGRSEPDGTFKLAGLLPGTYEISCYHDTIATPSKPIETKLAEGENVDDLVITFPGTGRIEGTVRDENGEPVAGVNVRLRGKNWSGGSQTNDEGRFVDESVEAGEYRITAERGWFETVRAPGATDDDDAGKRIEVRADETTEVELVVESQGGRITGQVLGEGGEPIADAFVEGVRESDSAAASSTGGRSRARWGSWMRQPVLTDEDGRFELTELAEGGTYTIYANRKGGGEGFAEHVDVGSDVEISIGQTGALAGIVRIDGGGHPERFKISVSDKTAGQWQNDSFFRTDGKWTISNLPPGKYEVTVDAAEGNAKTEVELSEGGAKDDIELTLTPRVTLRGRLVDASTGEGVPGLKVSIQGAGGGFTFFNQSGGKGDQKDISDAQGNFEVEDAATGLVNVIALPPGFTENDYGWTFMSRRIPAKPSEQDLGNIELLKDRVKQGEESGDLGFKIKEGEPETEPEDFRFNVAFVHPGSPAQKAGVVVGDEITHVDGQDITGLNSYRFQKLTQVLPGTKVELTLANEEGSRTVTLTAGPPR